MAIKTMESIPFKKLNIPAGESGYLWLELENDGTVERIEVNFVSGEQYTLQVRPLLERPVSQFYADLIKYPEGTEKNIIGDAKLEVHRISVPFKEGSRVGVWYNNAGVSPSILDVIITIDYRAGESSIIGGVVD